MASSPACRPPSPEGKIVLREVAAKGWPESRILNTTGRPLNPENTARDQFERDAVKALMSGKKSFERVEADAYRYAVPIPIVDKTCLTCHVRSKVGDVVGALSHRILLKTAKKKSQ